jgi:hypothetical protein
MHTKDRFHSFVWLFVLFVLLIGMSCSLFSGGAGNSRPEEQATPPAMPTTEGFSQEDVPIPLPSDAANFTSSQESFSYSTQLSVEDVAKFYQEKLPLLGWTIEQQGNMGGTLMWTVSRQDVTYLLNIMPSNGMTIVNASPIK